VGFARRTLIAEASSLFLDVRRIELLNHLHRSPAVLGNLINISAFHQTHADVGMPQTVCSPPIAIPVQLERAPLKKRIEHLDVVARKHMVGRLGQLRRLVRGRQLRPHARPCPA
jgi:hypothetical protein